jgi:hypothetical protein
MMKDTAIGNYTTSFGLSLAVTSLLSALLVVLKEGNEETVLAWMKVATGHHWVTHGVVDLVLFLVLGFVFAQAGWGTRLSGNALALTISTSVVLSGLIIAGFFV